MDGNRIRTSLRIHPILREDELSYLSFWKGLDFIAVWNSFSGKIQLFVVTFGQEASARWICSSATVHSYHFSKNIG